MSFERAFRQLRLMIFGLAFVGAAFGVMGSWVAQQPPGKWTLTVLVVMGIFCSVDLLDAWADRRNDRRRAKARRDQAEGGKA